MPPDGHLLFRMRSTTPLKKWISKSRPRSYVFSHQLLAAPDKILDDNTDPGGHKGEQADGDERPHVSLPPPASAEHLFWADRGAKSEVRRREETAQLCGAKGARVVPQVVHVGPT